MGTAKGCFCVDSRLELHQAASHWQLPKTHKGNCSSLCLSPPNSLAVLSWHPANQIWLKPRSHLEPCQTVTPCPFLPASPSISASQIVNSGAAFCHRGLSFLMRELIWGKRGLCPGLAAPPVFTLQTLSRTQRIRGNQ